MKPLRYRSPVDESDGSRWAPWVRSLGRCSGVYVIRDARTREILYVGESHTGRLYDTLTRHFQFWAGLTAGTTYDRNAVEVAARKTPPNAAFAAQVNLIKRLRPRDNEHHQEREPDDWKPSDFAD